VPAFPEVFVVGDLASVKIKEGQSKEVKTVPGVASAAVQMGRFAARQIHRSIAGKPRQDFVYKDKGSLATIGTSKAVANLGRLHFSGHLAWLAWLVVHLSFLTGFRNRSMVFLEWAWSYFTFNHGARLITQSSRTAFPSVQTEIRAAKVIGNP